MMRMRQGPRARAALQSVYKPLQLTARLGLQNSDSDLPQSFRNPRAQVQLIHVATHKCKTLESVQVDSRHVI